MKKEFTDEENKLFLEKGKSFFIGISIGFVLGTIICGLMVSYV